MTTDEKGEYTGNPRQAASPNRNTIPIHTIYHTSVIRNFTNITRTLLTGPLSGKSDDLMIIPQQRGDNAQWARWGGAGA